MFRYFLLSAWCLALFINNPITTFAGELNTLYRIGAVVSWGQPVTRVGLVGGVGFAYSYFNTNVEVRWHHNFRSYGPKLSSNEWQAKLALLGGFGSENVYHNIPNVYLPHFTQTDFGLGYSFNYYHDNIQTSQWTGSLIGRLYQVSIVLENDIFAILNQGDSYRTGTFQIFYADSLQKIEWRNVFYTGYTQCPARKHIREDPSYPARWGYIDYSECMYSVCSHGVSALMYQRRLDYEQTLGAGVGIDDERVRNFWQNKLIHDLPFFPARWNKAQNLHIPMVAEEDGLYLYEKGQEIRKTKMYWQISLNGGNGY